MKQKITKRTNVNSKQNYSKFGQHLHYLTPEKLQIFWEAVDDSRNKLILKLIFELGCRVGEFTKIQHPLVGVAAICYTSDICSHYFGANYRAKRSNDNDIFFTSRYPIFSKRSCDSARPWFKIPITY